MLLGHEKIDYLHLPTPLECLDNVSKDLGINLYIKRDDLTGIGVGGNKLRKLEYFLADAKAKGATMLLTVGGPQTNHGRLTGAVATKYGLKSAIVAVSDDPGEISANILLDEMMGCPLYLKAPDGIHSDDKLLAMAVKEVQAKYEAQGEKVYFIPMGGSNELGILGYYECAMELTAQAKEMGIENVHVITTCGSMGTYMGLFTGLKEEKSPLSLTGIGILPYDDIQQSALEYYERVKKFYGLTASYTKKDFDLTSDYNWGAYNNPVKEVRDAMYYMAQKEAIILDPCYTGKSFAGLLQMVKTGKIKQGENIIFMHTGGLPGIYTYHHRIEMEKELCKGVHLI